MSTRSIPPWPEPAAPPCAKCGEVPPEGAVYCPRCCGGRPDEQVLIRRGLRGILIGLLAVMPLVVWLLAVYGPIRGIKGAVFFLLVFGPVTGYMLSVYRRWR